MRLTPGDGVAVASSVYNNLPVKNVTELVAQANVVID
jgi:hypothetical protein